VGRKAARRGFQDDRPEQVIPRYVFCAVLVVLFALLLVLSLRQVASPDVGFHLKAGEQILSGHGWPRNDPFTYTVADHPYIDTSWGYQIVLALLHRAFGSPGLVLFHAGLVLGTFGAVGLTIRLASFERAAFLVLLLLGGVASEMRFETRPELASYLFLAVVLYLLHRHAEGKHSPLWMLVPIHLVWVNVHGLFVLGWVAEGCFFLGLLLRDRRIDRRLLLWAAASVAVTLVNPYGLQGMLFPLTLATRLQAENVFAQSIGEFTSPFALELSDRFPFYPRAPIWSFRAFALLSALALISALKRKRFWCALVWLAFMAISYRMIRNIPLLVIACLPATVWGLSLTSVLRTFRVGGISRTWLVRTAAVVVVVVTIVLGLRVYHDAYYIASRRTDRFGLGWNRLVQPIDSSDWANRSGLREPVLNHLNFGGWLIWSLPNPVFIDGRLEVMGEEFYNEYRNILASSDAMERCVAHYEIGWIIFPYSFNPKLLGRLSRDARWDLTYADHLAAIFVRADSVGIPLVARSLPGPPGAMPPVDSLPGIGEMPRRTGSRHWLAGLVRRETFPSEDYNLGLFHLYRGEFAPAASRFTLAILESEGAYYETYNNLGAVLFRMGRHSEARACYEIVLQEDPDNLNARKRLESIAQ
jgi:hypothetical protein